MEAGMKLRVLVASSVLLPLVLAGCENSGASYMIGGDKDHSISLVREQRWFWSNEVDQKLVVARFPKCQRRFDIAPGVKAQPTLEIYAVDDMLFVAHQDKDWWAVGTEDCQVQPFKTAPEQYGTLAGRFVFKNGDLVFEEKK